MRLAEARIPGIQRALTFSVHEHNDRHVSERIATEGVWEPFETELIRRVLSAPVAAGSAPERHLFVDCGANLGWYSIVAAALGASVVAFEPQPVNALLLRSNVDRNGLGALVEVHEMALGSEAGSGVLRLSVDNQGDHRVVPDGVVVASSPRAEIDVPIRRLDDVLNGRRPTVMKLDTQGSEVAILRGGRSAWTSPGVVIVLEFWPYGLERCGANADQLLDMLSELVDTTHSCFEILEWRTALRPLSMADLRSMASTGGYSAAMKGFTNIMLVPKERVPAVADLVVSDG